MATTQTERLERETEQTRAEVEHTLEELRARMSPAQLLDQATNYLRNSNGRAFVTNLRDQVVDNPLPVSLIGAGIAWLAVSGAIGRRAGGNGHNRGDMARNSAARDSMAHDWGETAATAGDISHGGKDYSREPRARYAAEEWADEAGSAVSEAGATMRETAHDLGGRAADMYEGTARGTRRMASKAAEYGRAARHAVEPDGTLITLCREQPMLVAGIGLAIGAALGALLPTSRPEQRIMGEASRDLKNQVRDAAKETFQAVAEVGSDARDQGGKSAAADVDRNVERGTGRPNVENEPQRTAPYAEAAGPSVATAGAEIDQGGAKLG